MLLPHKLIVQERKNSSRTEHPIWNTKSFARNSKSTQKRNSILSITPRHALIFLIWMNHQHHLQSLKRNLSMHRISNQKQLQHQNHLFLNKKNQSQKKMIFIVSLFQLLRFHKLPLLPISQICIQRHLKVALISNLLLIPIHWVLHNKLV